MKQDEKSRITISNQPHPWTEEEGWWGCHLSCPGVQELNEEIGRLTHEGWSVYIQDTLSPKAFLIREDDPHGPDPRKGSD